MLRSYLAIAIAASGLGFIVHGISNNHPDAKSSISQRLPISLCELTLDRAFSYAIDLPAPTPSQIPEFGNSYHCTTQFPIDRGAAITEISGMPHQGTDQLGVRVRVSINGQTRRVFTVPSVHVASDRYEFNPPLIVHPSECLTIDILAGSGGVFAGRGNIIVANVTPAEFTIAGWWLLPGEAD